MSRPITRRDSRLATARRHLIHAAAAFAAVFITACGDSPVAPAGMRGVSQAASLAAPGSLGVLILDVSVSGGINSREAQAAIALGHSVTMVNTTQWGAMTAAEFGQYRAIILGDPTCRAGYLGAAITNRAVWGPVVNGNAILIGTDPVFHYSRPGAAELVRSGIKFAVDAPGQTGAYITLSCDANAAGVLQGLSTAGTFAMTHTPSCGTNVAIVANHPSLVNLTAASLSGWGCSIHEIFTQWPSDFDVLAIALDGSTTYTAPDGTRGTPYILARGRGLVVVSDISLAPGSATPSINTSHTITATVRSNDAPVASTTVTFTVVDGPNAGQTATATTDANGTASFTYSSSVEGTDGVRATFVDALNRTQSSNRAVVTWTRPLDVTPPVITPTVTGTLGSNGWYTSDVSVTFAVSDPESAVTSTSGCEARSLTADQAEQTYTCTATSAGGTASASASVKIDGTLPVVTYTGNAGSYTVDQSIAIACTPSDNLSGVASSTCAPIAGAAYTFALGTNTYSANAVDGAGNTGTGSATFTVSVTPASLCALVQRWTSNAGVANSLCVKLDHGTYAPFRNEVSAQSGKKISQAHADILLRLVAGL